MPRALVTGASGHGGANICRELAASDYDVVPFVRRTSDLRAIELLGLAPRFGDVRDAASLRAAAEGCDLIFHTAAVYDMSGRTTAEIVEPAVTGARRVFAAAAEARVRRVIYTSSSSQSGRHAGQGGSSPSPTGTRSSRRPT